MVDDQDADLQFFVAHPGGDLHFNMVDLCESLLDGRDLHEIDDTHYHRHIAMAG